MNVELQKRLAALEEYQIMDSMPEQAFDDLTRLTSFICDTPIALVTLLDHQRQWFKSKVGLDVNQTPLEHAFCRIALEQKQTMIVTDASVDERFCDNPYVTSDPHIRFYAGAQLVTPSGVPLGTLCAIDRVPRVFSSDQLNALESLARQVIQMMELRKTVNALRIALEEKHAAQKEVITLKKLLPMCAWCHNVRNDESYWQTVENYICTHADLQITHGICPSCAEKVKADMEKKMAERAMTTAIQQ